MVERKRRKIAKKPQTQNLDSWVTEGGVDPEIESFILPDKVESVVPPTKEKTKEVAKKAVPSTSEKSESEKTYPHRISFDMESPQYKRLKWASFETERPMNSILREAVEEWMSSRNY